MLEGGLNMGVGRWYMEEASFGRDLNENKALSFKLPVRTPPFQYMRTPCPIHAHITSI